VSVAEPSNDPSRFSKGCVDPYGGRLLPICCPDAASVIFGDRNPASPISVIAPIVAGEVENWRPLPFKRMFLFIPLSR
jgi:hypothetical protein